MISSIDGKRLSKKYPAKIHPFPGPSAADMHDYLRLLLRKCPDTIILHVGTNNCVNKSSRVVLDKILNTAQKMKFSIKDFFSKCYQIHSFLQIWSHLLKRSLMEKFIFVECNLKSSTSKSSTTYYHNVK